jgi:diguanylate cyclase (GGDEF)-like protein
MNPEGFAIFMLLWWLCMTIAITLGMVLMTSERLQANLDKQANRDPLTGALNRRAFSVIAEKEIARSVRYETPLSLLMMDLDKFKHINDQFGHDAGDALLCRFVTIANQILRDEDIFCRYGGEEFIAMLPNASAEIALTVAERLRTALATESTSENTGFILPVTVSIGIAERSQEEDIESLLLRSDVALYNAKRNGRDCCKIAEGINKSSETANIEQQIPA